MIFIQAHPHHEKYLNKKIEMYDEMALVVRKDIATGSFVKSFADLDMDTEIDSTPLQDEFDFEEVSKASSIPSTQKRSHQKRKHNSNSDDEGIEKLAMEVKEVAIAPKEMSKDRLIVSNLYTKVMKTEDFDEITLATVFDYLVQNEMFAKAFIAKNATLRKIWVQKFIDQHGRGSEF
ncbi:hypothetical protein DITRI_Ditri10aG0160900 [Diplodiscus trichospermus]